MIRRLGYDEPLPSKAWVLVPATESVPGTEDDEKFYLPMEAKKEHARQYAKEHHAHIREVAREWYQKHRDRWHAVNGKWQQKRYRGKKQDKQYVQG